MECNSIKNIVTGLAFSQVMLLVTTVMYVDRILRCCDMLPCSFKSCIIFSFITSYMITLKYFPTVVLEFVYLSDNNVYRTHIHESLKVQYLLRYIMHYTIKVNMFYTAPLYHRTASIIPTVHYFFFSTHLTWQLLKQELDWAGLEMV